MKLDEPRGGTPSCTQFERERELAAGGPDAFLNQVPVHVRSVEASKRLSYQGWCVVSPLHASL